MSNRWIGICYFFLSLVNPLLIFVKKLFLKIDLADLEALQCLEVLPAVGLVYSGIAGLDCLPPPAGPGSSLPSPTF